jgi:hypothetical protein
MFCQASLSLVGWCIEFAPWIGESTLTPEAKPTIEGQIVTEANNAVRKGANANLVQAPLVPLAEGADPIVVTFRLSAKDATDFAQHLRKVIPVTRIASGCRYSHTYQAPNASAEFVLLQGWDSAVQQ